MLMPKSVKEDWTSVEEWKYYAPESFSLTQGTLTSPRGTPVPLGLVRRYLKPGLVVEKSGAKTAVMAYVHHQLGEREEAPPE